MRNFKKGLFGTAASLGLAAALAVAPAQAGSLTKLSSTSITAVQSGAVAAGGFFGGPSFSMSGGQAINQGFAGAGHGEVNTANQSSTLTGAAAKGNAAAGADALAAGESTAVKFKLSHGRR